MAKQFLSLDGICGVWEFALARSGVGRTFRLDGGSVDPELLWQLRTFLISAFRKRETQGPATRWVSLKRSANHLRISNNAATPPWVGVSLGLLFRTARARGGRNGVLFRTARDGPGGCSDSRTSGRS